VRARRARWLTRNNARAALSNAPTNSQQIQHFAAASGFLPRRLHEHATGRGARLVAVALAAGCRFELVRLWVGGQTLERRLKQQRAVPRLLCPACPTRAQARRLAAGQAALLGPVGGAPR